jgi:hypothetical protein
VYKGFGSKIEVFLVVSIVGIVSYILLFKKAKELQSGQPKQCEYSKEWSEYGACSTECGTNTGWQYSTRSIQTYATNGGVACDPTLLLRSQSCGNPSVSCGLNCVPGNPELVQWSSCPTCIYGNESASQWKIVPPIQLATDNGQDCDIDSVYFQRLCSAAVPQCPPDIDCKLDLFATSTCTRGPCEVQGQSGFQVNIYTISSQSSGRGRPCDFRLLKQIVPCASSGANCDCTGVQYGSWSECNASCGPGVQIQIATNTGGISANCPLVNFRPCTLVPCPPNCIPPSIDLVIAECYLRCAGLPTSTVNPLLCWNESILDAVCGPVANCAPPSPCSLSAWSAFGACPSQCSPENPLGSFKTRQRTIVKNAVGGGQPCSDPNLILTATEPCSNYIPITYSAYDTATDNFYQAVQPPSCAYDPPCQPSAWYAVTNCDNSFSCLSVSSKRPDLAYGTQILNRSFTNPPGQQGDCFTKDESYFWSISICGFSDKGPQFGLQSCTQCLWAQKTLTSAELASMCSSNTGAPLLLGKFPNDVVRETNVRGDSCASQVQECDHLIPDRTTCSILTRPCNDVSMCPVNSTAVPPTICNAKGISEFYINTNPLTRVANPLICSCSCFNSFTGPSCTTARTPCPLGINGLECSGFGTCNAGICTCSTGIPQTANCSDVPWCWVYGSIQGTSSQYRKLLGAIALQPGYFDSISCINLNRDITSRLPNQFIVQQPTPLNYNLDLLPNSGMNYTQSIYKAAFETTVMSYAPPNMVANNVGCAKFDPLYSTENLLELNLVSSSSFKAIKVPNTVPSRCENILTFSAFSQTSIPLKPIARPYLTSNTANFSKQQYTATKMITLSKFVTQTIVDSNGNTSCTVDFGDIQATIFNQNYQFKDSLDTIVNQTFEATISGQLINQDVFKLTYTSITFPWLPNAFPVQPWMNTPNDADLFFGNFSASNCFVYNPNPVFNTNCPGIRNIQIFSTRSVVESFADAVTFTAFNFMSRSQIGANDPSFNHPYCTDPVYGTQLNLPINSQNVVSTPQGSRFLCQLSRYFITKGVGAIMPVQFIYSTSLSSVDFLPSRSL